MKQYLISIYQPDGPPPDVAFLGDVMREIFQIREELQAQGAWVFAGGLHDVSSATVVRVRNGEAVVTDGPFTEGKEHLGGFTIIRVVDLDAALGWAKRYARATTLPVEVRPFMDEGGG